MRPETEDDPLYMGRMDYDFPVPLGSGRKILGELRERVTSNKMVDDYLTAEPEVMDVFSRVFPEVVEWNDVGKMSQGSFHLWKDNVNHLIIEPDTLPPADAALEHDVYIGGPAVLYGAAIQSQTDESANVHYVHDGNRGASNWKGSASYYHVRDAIPVYYWPDNHGAYTLYASCKHWIERNFMPARYLKNVTTDPNWNKLRLSILGILREPSIFWLFAKNQAAQPHLASLT